MGHDSALGTRDQVRAERRALAIVAHPRVQAAMADVRTWLLSEKATTRDAERTLDRAVTLWTHALAMRELGADLGRTQVLWTFEDAPHAWHGHVFPGMGLGGIDNPDNIYRSAAISGEGAYEVRIHRRPETPVQFTIEVNGSTSRRKAIAGAGFVDFGTQVRMLSEADLAWDESGASVLRLGPEDAGSRRDYVQLPPEPCRLLFRDTLGDWRQKPCLLSIQRTDGASAEPSVSDDELVAQVAAGLRPWIETWNFFRENWLGRPANNTVAGPLSRDGGWGLLAGGWYDLQDDAVLAVTVLDGGAPYVGFQTTDNWAQTPDARVAFSSRSNAQARRDADGAITFLISAKDPGYANWVGTGGCNLGLFAIRWQVLPNAEAIAQDLVRRVRVLKASQLKDELAAGQKVSPTEREIELAQRIHDYDLRLSA